MRTSFLNTYNTITSIIGWWRQYLFGHGFMQNKNIRQRCVG